MNASEILNNSALTPQQKMAALTQKTILLPGWGMLEKEYDPRKHPVYTDENYVNKAKNGKIEKLTRISLAWQRLAVQRMKPLIFGIPVKRVYNDHDDERQKVAVQVMEDIYRRNRINAVNLERAENLYASCENVTIWYAVESATTYAGQASRLKVRCKNYAPIKGDELYPLFDEYNDLIALSVKYSRTEDGKNVTYFDTYTEDRHICWNAGNGDVVVDEAIKLGKIPGVYIYRKTPIWESESDNVYEAEWVLSRQGNYVRKNSRPAVVICTDNDIKAGKAPKGDDVARDIIRLGAGDSAQYLTWPASTEAVKYQVEEIKRNFYGNLQLPDVSMDNMKSTPMSGESRKMVFIDAQMKVTNEQGIWLEFLDREFNVLRTFAKAMFPNLAAALDALEVESIITPYQIKDETERVNTLSTAVGGPIASRLTAIKRLGWATDVDAEAEQIEKENAGDVFNPME